MRGFCFIKSLTVKSWKLIFFTENLSLNINFALLYAISLDFNGIFSAG